MISKNQVNTLKEFVVSSSDLNTTVRRAAAKLGWTQSLILRIAEASPEFTLAAPYKARSYKPGDLFLEYSPEDSN